MAEAFSPQEQALIERLQNAPQSALSVERFDAIRAQMLQAMDAPPAPTPRTGITLSTPVIAVAAVVIVMIIIVIVVTMVHCKLRHIGMREFSHAAPTHPRIHFQRALAIAQLALVGRAPCVGHNFVQPRSVRFFSNHAYFLPLLLHVCRHRPLSTG